VTDPQSASRRSDIYSLGILLYRLITGKAPYEDVEQAVEAGRDPPLDLELLRSELTRPGSEDFMSSPEDAVGVITRMCRLDPAQRYADMDGVLEDLAILA
jgi:serine/threonine-protein kinase